MVFTNVIKMPCYEAWVERPVGRIKEGGGAQMLKVICAGLSNVRRECLKRMKIYN